MTTQLDTKSFNTTDKTVGEALGPYEESATFFESKKVTVNKESVNLKDKLYVDGLESVISSFGSHPCYTEHDGNEGLMDTAKRVMATIVRLAKDATEFLVNIINNKLIRLDNALHRIKTYRKVRGLVAGEVRYPIGVRRLMIPNKITVNPGWIAESINEVKSFYNKSIDAYKGLLDLISIDPEVFNAEDADNKLNTVMAKCIGLAPVGKDNAGSSMFVSSPLPGNRYFCFSSRPDTSSERPVMMFQDTGMDARLKNPMFEVQGHIVDKTIDAIQGLIDEVRKNQRTVSELYRTFEKAVVAFERKAGTGISASQRQFLRYLVAHNKRLSQMSVQYVTASADVGMDFCRASINK